MAKTDLIIRSAYLTTKEKSPKKSILVNKILNDYDSDNFIFYLIEINAETQVATPVQKAIIKSIEDNSKNNHLFDQDLLETILSDVNSALDKIAKSGQNNWIGNLNATIGVIDRNILSLASTGKLAGYLFRKGKISSLTEEPNTTTLPQKTFIDLTSGPLSLEDRVVFANIALFDHYSLDRVRRLSEAKDPIGFISEIHKDLKHKRVKDINVIALETKEDDGALEENELPVEMFILDEKEETAVDKLKKAVLPASQKLAQSSQKLLKNSGHAIAKNSKSLYSQSKEKWNNKIKPKTKELIEKSAPAVSETYKKVKNKVEPTIKNLGKNNNLKSFRIKTKLYSKEPESKFGNMMSTILITGKHFFVTSIKKENRKYLYIVLIVCFLGIGYMKIRSNNIARDKNNKVTQIANTYPEAVEAYDKAKEDLGLGKPGAKDELVSALALAKTAAGAASNKDKAEALVKDIQASIDKLSSTTRIYNPSPSIKVGSKITKSILVGSDIFVINQDGKIYTANVNSSDVSLVASIGKDNGDAIDLTYAESDGKIFILTNKQKVIAYNIASKTNELVSMNEGKDWESADSIAAFAGNLYLLNNETGEIVKHSKQETGFSKGSIYSDSKKVNLKDSINLVIDGNVYALLGNGQVAKFSKGVYDDTYSIKSIPDPDSTIKSPSKIYTTADNNSIYIFDRSQNRIIKFDKSGEFSKQYAFDGITIEDFMVNDKVQKMWVISDSNIYQLDL